MHNPDLTPSIYRERSRKRAAVRLWSLSVIACGALAVLPITIESSQGDDDSAELAQQRLTQAQSRLAQSQAQGNALKAQLAQHERELKAEEHLTRRPDWSDALQWVAAQFDDELMMTGLQLGKAQDSGIRSGLGLLAPDVPKSSVWLVVEGVAAENGGVPALLLRLERLGLFKRVVMTKTQRQTFAGSPRTSFTLACRVE